MLELFSNVWFGLVRNVAFWPRYACRFPAGQRSRLFVYGEPFGLVQIVGYGAIWIALAVYWLEWLWHARARNGALADAADVRAGVASPGD